MLNCDVGSPRCVLAQIHLLLQSSVQSTFCGTQVPFFGQPVMVEVLGQIIATTSRPSNLQFDRSVLDYITY